MDPENRRNVFRRFGAAAIGMLGATASSENLPIDTDGTPAVSAQEETDTFDPEAEAAETAWIYEQMATLQNDEILIYIDETHNSLFVFANSGGITGSSKASLDPRERSVILQSQKDGEPEITVFLEVK